MSATGPSPSQEDLKQFSDERLIQSYCGIPASREENSLAQAIAKELWNRHDKSVMYRALRIPRIL